MIFKDPKLKLEFTKDDIKEGHSLLQTVGRDGIVSRSISISYQLFSSLKSSSNTVSITILGESEAVEDIIVTEGNIKAQLLDGDKVVFTGYLSTSFSWTVTDYGTNALTLTIEDVGTRLLEKPFIDSGVHLFRCSGFDAVKAIADKFGIELSETFPSITEEVTRVVEDGKTGKELLTELLYELGYVYYFNSMGKLDAWKIECSTIAGVPLLDHSKLYSVGGTAISLSKSLRQYSASRVSYTALGTAERYLVYRNTTGKGDGHPYCHLPLNAGEVFDGSEVFTKTDGEEVILPKIEAVNALSETDIVGSNKIIAISNLSSATETDSGYIAVSVKAAGGPYMEIHAENTGHLTYYINKLDAYADIIYEKSENIIRAGTDPTLAESSNLMLDEELKWVHSKEKATEHANLIAQYHRNAGSVYSFYTGEDVKVGEIVKLADSVHSGLAVPVLVFAKTVTDESGVASFRAVAIAPFSLTDKVLFETLIKKQGNLKGEDGKDGESYSVLIHSDKGSVFRPPNIDTTLSCQVLKNNEDITASLENWRFTWSRVTSDPTGDEKWNTSSKAIGHKEIDITDTDCSGRTVFICSVEL